MPDTADHHLQDVLGRQYRLILKELRETLRDRRTVLTLVLMPLLVYPLLSLGLQRLLLTGVKEQEEEPAIVMVQRSEQDELVRSWLERGVNALRREGLPDVAWRLTFAVSDRDDHPDAVPQAVRTGKADVGLAAKWTQSDRVEVTLYYRQEPISLAALERLERILHAAHWAAVRQQLAQARIPVRLPALEIRPEKLQPEAGPSPLATLMPLVLILMTITGAVYPAIDLTAGERERGTLETLIAAPVARWRLLVAKYVAVLAVALLTASVNLVAMTVTLHVSGLTSVVFGPAGLSIAVIALVFMLLLIFAGFFSALLLSITSVARSFKEAQAYLIPLMLVALAPGLLSMVPGLELNAVLAALPLVNIVLVARDLFQGTASAGWVVVSLITTLFYAAAALSLASYVFGSDAILYGSALGWSSVGRRPVKPLPVASPSIAWSCLAIAFPLQFMAAGFVVHAALSPPARLLAAALITLVVFALLPLSISWWYRMRLGTALGVAPVRWHCWAVALLLGLSLWPLAHGCFLLAARAGLATLDSATLERIRHLLIEWQQLPTWYLIAALGIVPGVCEELFFRGLVYGAVEKRLGASRAILLAALLFAAFHVVTPQWLAIERFAPSFVLGLVLGTLRWQARSVLPAMLTHALHNSLLLSLTPFASTGELIGVQFGKIPPLAWYWYALSLAAFAIWWAAWRFTRRRHAAVAKSQ
ncbi:MAG: sodium extrusion protein NatB [Pirellulaceae bacterium]|nr:MAG: sodium extrusion protein NatB [Pirellulaceae bacterium]